MEEKSFIARYAKIATALGVIAGATSGIWGTLISASSMAIGFWRLTIALPFFAIPILIRKEGRESLKAVSTKNIIWCLIAGVFLFGHFFSWFSAVKSTNLASAAVLAALHPLVVLILTVFVYKKKVSIKAVAAIIVALIGGAIITGADLATLSGGHLSGNIFAFGAALFMGLYFAVGDKVRKEVSGGIYVLIVFFGCWLSFSAGMLITQTPFVGYPQSDYIYLIVMAIVCQIGAHAVFNLCIGHVSALYVSTWEAGEPVVATVLGILVLKQIPTIYEILGCIIVVGALLYYNRQETH